MGNGRNLPAGWVTTSLGEMFDFQGGGTPSKKVPDYWDGKIPWASVKDIKQKYLSETIDSITDSGLKNSAANIANPGSLLVLTRIEPGKAAIPKVPIAVNQDCKIASPKGSVDPEWAYYFFIANEREFLNRSSGTTVLGIRLSELKSVPVHLPPLNEQHRIVTKIEELFSELDKGVDSLKTARAQLKTYRQSLLKAAFEGRLTEQWRKDNAEQFESAEALLDRIRGEREVRYQEQLADWEAAVDDWGKQGKPGKKPRKPDAPLFLEGEYQATEKTQRPRKWCRVKVGDVFSVYVGATPSRKKPEFWLGEINWVSSGEVAFCEISETKETISEIGLENTSTRMHPPGTVILAMIGEGKTRGQAAILRTTASHNQNTAAIRVSESGMDPYFLYFYFLYRYEANRRLGSGNNQKALNKKRVMEMDFPLPPVKEQKQIIDIIVSALTQIDELSKTLFGQLERAQSLRQSILKRAFEGKLVPQDPNDEPASELLERIRQEQDEKPAPAPRKRRKQEATADLFDGND